MTDAGALKIQTDSSRNISKEKPAILERRGWCPFCRLAKSFIGKNYFSPPFCFLFKLSFAKQVWQQRRAPNLVPLDLCCLDWQFVAGREVVPARLEQQNKCPRIALRPPRTPAEGESAQLERSSHRKLISY